jgi:decaprenylphospho-beta-D-erythro-pentofuranosid-2-ulose 2-reductase
VPTTLRKLQLNILIIGASSGIGRECAHVFSSEGHSVICSSRDEDELGNLASDLKIRYNCQAYAVSIDLAQPSCISNFVEEIYAILHKLDCVIVTAGTMPPDGADYSDQNALLNTTMTNYIGIATLLNDVSKRMTEVNAGTIVCLSSVAGDRGRQSNFIYGATKSALSTYLQGLRMKLNRHNIQVITILPGYVDTLMSYGKVKAVLAVSPTYFAKRIYKLSKSRRNVVYVPAIWWLVAKVLKSIPEAIYKRLHL